MKRPTPNQGCKHDCQDRCRRFYRGVKSRSPFQPWFDEAERTEINDANAMTLATVDQNGMPNARVVLLKGLDAARLRFLHQYREREGAGASGDPESLAVLSLEVARRQVRIRGTQNR